MLYWKHITTGPLEQTVVTLESARNGTFGKLSTEKRAAQIRVLLALSLQAATITTTPGPLGLLSPALYNGDNERNAAGAAIARTAILLAPKDKPFANIRNVWTFNGDAPFLGDPELPDTSALPAIAIVAIACAAAAAAGYIATIITQAQHGISFEEEKTKRLIAGQATGIDMMGKHIEREKLAGKLLPFDDEERKAFRSIEDTQREVLNDKLKPLPSPFDGAREFAQAVADTTKKIGESTADTISMIAPIALVGGLVWLGSR